MRKLAFRVAFAVLACGPAHAQEIDTASNRIEMVGDAPAACVVSPPAATGGQNATFSPGDASNSRISITQLVDQQNALSQASSIQLSVPATCNSSHRVVVRSSNGGLARGGVGTAAGGGGGFGEFLPYDVAIDWAGKSIAQTSDQGVALLETTQPGTGTVSIRVATRAGGGPLVAGQYTDSIIIEFQPSN